MSNNNPSLFFVGSLFGTTVCVLTVLYGIPLYTNIRLYVRDKIVKVNRLISYLDMLNKTDYIVSPSEDIDNYLDKTMRGF